MVTVSPSLLSANFLNLEQEIKSFSGIRDLWLHLDIMDGHFVKNLTYGPVVVKNIRTITNHKLDAHLMVTNPEDHFEWFSECGISNITFHLETQSRLKETIRLVEKAKRIYPSVGISINPDTDVSKLKDELLTRIDLVLVMSVYPGKGGQKFIPESIEKIRSLTMIKKNLGHDFTIQVDGGISDKNSMVLIDAGATNLVAGSYIFSQTGGDYKSKIELLRER